jgi:two-component system chemotaxis response regulator CheB
MIGSKIRVLIVDDSSFMRSLLKRIIEKDERFEVIASAKDGAEGVELAKKLQPHIVTMDIEMPVMNGLEALEKIMKEDPRPVVMVSSLTEEGATATLKALDLGAIDFLPKAMQDKDKNILSAGGILHEKLATAARAGTHMNRVMQPPICKPSITQIPKPVANTESRPASNNLIHKAIGSFPAKILVIGSSTGGPKALACLLEALPKLSVPIVIAQHMPAKFTLAMAERINKNSDMRVKEAEHGEILESGTVYIAPGGVHMRIKPSGTSFMVDVHENQGESVYKPSVEVLGKSVFDAVNKNVVAVMLTGMGSDGADAFEKIHQAGGYVIAQDKESCVVYGMSRSVVEKNAANEILPLEGIGRKLVQLLS